MGLTYEEAKLDLYQKLPQIGILETVKLNSVKVSTLNSYAEQNVLHKDINVNFDRIMIHNCKIGGQYAVTALIPAEDINYVPNQIRSVTDISKHLDFKNAKRTCGNDMYSIVVSLNDDFEISGAKRIKQTESNGVSVVIVCGQFSLMSKWYNHGWTTDVRQVFTNNHNLIYLGSYRAKDIQDYSLQMNLEMLKNLMF